MVEFLPTECECCNAQSISIGIPAPNPHVLKKFDNNGVFQWRAFQSEEGIQTCLDIDILNPLQTQPGDPCMALAGNQSIVLAMCDEGNGNVNSSQMFTADGSEFSPWSSKESVIIRRLGRKLIEGNIGRISSGKFTIDANDLSVDCRVIITNAGAVVSGGVERAIFRDKINTDETPPQDPFIEDIDFWDQGIADTTPFSGTRFTPIGKIYIGLGTTIWIPGIEIFITTPTNVLLTQLTLGMSVIGQWTTSDPGGSSEKGVCVTQDSTGDFTYCGTALGNLVKLSSFGVPIQLTELWLNTTDMTNSVNAIVMDSNDDPIVVSGNKVLKFSKVDGSLISELHNHGAVLYDITIDSSDNLYICGETNIVDNSSVKKLDSTGTEIWKQSIDFESLGTIARSIKLDVDDNIYVGHDTNLFD